MKAVTIFKSIFSLPLFMKIFIERTKETKQLDFNGTVQELLDTLGILYEDVLVLRDGSLITEDEEVSSTDSLTLLSVISGG